MNKIRSHKQALKLQIQELEETLASLEKQLQQEIENEQHEAIDQLETYLDKVNKKYASLQEFWLLLQEEIKGMFDNKESPPKGKNNEHQ